MPTTDHVKLIASLAAQLSRQQRAHSLLVQEIADDAIALVREADRRAASVRAPSLRAASRLAARYDAEVRTAGRRLGLKFFSGLYHRTGDNIFWLD